MIFYEDKEKIFSAEELRNSELMKYDILYIKNVKRDENKSLIQCSVIAMEEDTVYLFKNEQPKGTEEVFLTDKGRFNAFGSINLMW